MADKARLLTLAEVDAVHEVFGGQIRYDRVRLQNGAGGNPAAMMAFKNGNTAITLRNRVYYRPDLYSDDFTAEGADKPLFVHEMTHVWQYSRLGVVRFLARYGRELAACRFRPGDMYKYEKGKTRFSEARLEAQAQMAGDYCHALLKKDEPLRQQVAINLQGSGLYGL